MEIIGYSDIVCIDGLYLGAFFCENVCLLLELIMQLKLRIIVSNINCWDTPFVDRSHTSALFPKKKKKKIFLENRSVNVSFVGFCWNYRGQMCVWTVSLFSLNVETDRSEWIQVNSI